MSTEDDLGVAGRIQSVFYFLLSLAPVLYSSLQASLANVVITH